jgi:uncharacterized Zn finger protein
MAMDVTTAVYAKARRLAADKVTVHSDADDVTLARVEGDHATYVVVLDPEGHHCTCPAGEHFRVCSHVAAVTLVVEACICGVTEWADCPVHGYQEGTT